MLNQIAYQRFLREWGGGSLEFGVWSLEWGGGSLERGVGSWGKCRMGGLSHQQSDLPPHQQSDLLIQPHQIHILHLNIIPKSFTEDLEFVSGF